MPQVFAHGDPADLEYWGGFGPRAAGCQRRIGRAANRCALEAWIARRGCRDADLDGRSCDQDATQRTIDRARVEAAASITEPTCRDGPAAILGFLGVDEARSDVSGACRDTARIVESAAYPPAPESDADRRCVAAVATAATHLLSSSVRARTGALDFIALRLLTPSAKQALIRNSEERIEAVMARMEQRLARACQGSDFVALYGRTPEDVFANILRQADCLVGQAYAQAAIACRPAP